MSNGGIASLCRLIVDNLKIDKIPEFVNKSSTTSRAGGMRKAPGRSQALLMVADLINSIHKSPRFSGVTVEPFQFSPAEPVAYEGS